MSTNDTQDRRSNERNQIRSQVEFFIAGDILTAESIDISESGLRFQTEKPLCIHLRTMIDGQYCEKKALLIWANKNPDDTMSYGFEFLSDNGEYII